MKCYYHREQDAAGTCSQCGKAACHDCLEDVGRAMLCRGCLSITAAEVEEEQAQQVEDQAQQQAREVEAARKRLRLSRILFPVGMVVGLLLGVVNFLDVGARGDLLLPFLAIGLLIGYAIWAGYWGIPAVWRLWKRLLGRLREQVGCVGCFLEATPAGWLVLTFFFLWFFVIAGLAYGIYGGAFWERHKCAQLARGQSAPS